MGKKLSFTASRHKGVRLFRWSVLALAGVASGAMLGEMAAGTRLGGGGTDEPASYSHLSANPDALVAQGDGGILPCPGCADSYGVALRLRADDDRMSNEFRELGAVDIDPPILADAGDDYRYGGRFPDPEPGAAVTSADPQAPGPADESPAPDMMTPVPAEY